MNNDLKRLLALFLAMFCMCSFAVVDTYALPGWAVSAAKSYASSSKGSSSSSSKSSGSSSSSSSTASLTAQMAANSAAWHVANAAGDKATCDALHAQNEALSKQLASGGGSASFDSASGTWDITTSSGDNIKSSGSGSSKNTSVSYTTSSGSSSNVNSAPYTVKAYSNESISSYLSSGGTKEGLQTAYNKSANQESTTGVFTQEDSAAAEAAVAQVLLGLTDAQTKQLQKDLEDAKNAYVDAKFANNAEAMKAAHDLAESIRAKYNYTGDTSAYFDGGYMDISDSSSSSRSDSESTSVNAGSSNSGAFNTTLITKTYAITSSAGTGGSISPNGQTNVVSGNSQTYTITAAEGYVISRVLVDGKSVGAVASYSFSDVKATHNISAEFKLSPKLEFKTTPKITSESLNEDGSIKSGYGFSTSIQLDTNAMKADSIRVTATYNFGNKSATRKTIQLENTSGGWVFPKNSESATKARKVYVPVNTADGKYTVTYTATAVDQEGNSHTKTISSELIVKGSMYEDDFTGRR